VLLAVAAWAQTNQDARPLLEAISDAVRAAGSVRAEGVNAEDPAAAAAARRETRFEVVTQGPLLMRYHAGYGPNQVLQVCDGTSRWTYQELPNTYTRATDNERVCAPLVARWNDLTEGVVTARVTGRDHSEFEGHDQECTVIEISYAASRRTLCVDPVRHLVLRERTEYPAGQVVPNIHQRRIPGNEPALAQTITYSHVEYGLSQSAEVFQFHPPPGSSQAGSHAPLMGEGGAGNYAGPGPASSAPVPISTSEPQYSPEALAAGLQGTVLVSLVVDEKGRPQDIKVVRGLSLGLDEKAIQAVGTWQFKPGYRAGQPVAAPTQVVITFRKP
jgi:TonB family protein